MNEDLRDAIMADLRAHPGSRSAEIAARLDCDPRMLGSKFGVLAREGAVRREVGKGRKRASFWSCADAESAPRARRPDFITPDDLSWMAHWNLPRAERKRRELEAGHAL